MLQQRTVKAKITGSGISLHEGVEARFSILPAAPGTGLVFVRTDLPTPVEIEHLLAALYALGIDNARIEVDGPELPILDGSAMPFVELIRAAGGPVAQRAPRRFLVVRRPVSVVDGDRSVRLEPASSFKLACTIDFDHAILRRQHLEVKFSDAVFIRELARARTFGFGRDVDAMHAAGLAKGGSVDNAVVIDDFSIRNPEGLRFPDEFVRHKLVDAVGDLALLGAPLIGRYVGIKGGHSLNTELAKKLLADARAHELVEFRARRDVETLGLDLPALDAGLQPA
ncbi:UDP-3-O-acyl-N-acetylglucosamine deacetylase [Myxococcota bacterium]|nr:UDP-3-O-acyl-N-acetylglucosamine deacetylase [Myxococcota bacterium]